MNRNPLSDFFVYAVCASMFLLNTVLEVGNGYGSIAIISFAMFVAFLPHDKTSLGIVMVFSGMTLFVIPFTALVAVQAGVTTGWFALYVIIGKTIIIGSEQQRLSPVPLGASNNNLPLLIMLLVAGLGIMLIGWGTSGGGEQIFYGAWALGLIHLERLHASTSSTTQRIIGLVVIYAAIGIYSLVFWSGFGRLIIASLALAPLILTSRYRTFRLNVFAFALVTASLPFIGRVLRFGWSDGLAGLAEDSGASPITFTEGLWRGSGTILSAEPVWHQWSLLFLQWFPRSFWPNKPIGLGSSFVDAFIGRSGLSEEHSIAIGYFGEHIYIAHAWWFVSVALLTVTIIVLRRTVNRVCAPYASAAIVFDVWLVTLFWGGMASFGARVWFSVIPMVAYIMLLNAIRKTNDVAQSGLQPSLDTQSSPVDAYAR